MTDEEVEYAKVFKSVITNILNKIFIKPIAKILEFQIQVPFSFNTQPFPTKGIPCEDCAVDMFQVTTPMGADCHTCPLCAKYLDEDGVEAPRDTNFNKLCKCDYCISDSYCAWYCNDCKIVFDAGCSHGINGCTEDIYHAVFIKQVYYNNQALLKPNQTPRFRSFKELEKIIHQSKFDWICTCHGGCPQCPKAYYFPIFPGTRCCNNHL